MKQIVPRKPHQTPLPHEKSGKARRESGILIALSRVYILGKSLGKSSRSPFIAYCWEVSVANVFPHELVQFY